MEIHTLGDVLHCIAFPPNKRNRPTPSDVRGQFDFWFDGGACRVVTGWTEYQFSSGVRAIVRVIGMFSVTVTFPNGSCVHIDEDPR
jgi:hypothetical protein